MNEIFVLFTLIYSIVAFCFVYKTDLFVSVGLTIENLFDRYLGREQDNFVLYHIKRTCTSTVVHLSLHCGFFIGTSILKAQDYFISILGDFIWQVILFGSVAIPIHALCIIVFHYRHKWDSHPIVTKLKQFENERYNSWTAVQNEINNEYKQLEKTILHCGNRMKLVLTRNWIVKVGTYDLDFANQNDARLVVQSADTHDAGNNGHYFVVQFIDVKVIYLGESREFCFRLHAFDFKDLKEGLRCPIEVSPNVKFHQTKTDEFLQIFREFVENNVTYTLEAAENESCMGCMNTEANVKLKKNCTNDHAMNETDDGAPLPPCVSCLCKPLWCIDCMGKWFASRQNQSATETWLSSKCTCPVCRSTFCMLDVSPVVRSPS